MFGKGLPWGAAVVLLACTPVDPTSGPASKASVEPAPNHAPSDSTVAPRPRQVVTTLQTRDHEITVYTTPEGPRFTIAAAGGTVLAEQLTTREFRASFPGLHERYDSAFAEDGAVIDASAESRTPTEPSAP